MSSKKQQYYEGLTAAARPMEEFTEVLNYIDKDLKEGRLTQIGKKAYNLIHEYFLLEAYAHAPMGNIIRFLARWERIDSEELKEFERPIAFRSSQIYDIICNVSPDNAYMILTKLSEYSDVYESLCQAYENKDKDGFIQVMSENKCDTKAVTEICNFYSKIDTNSIINEIDDNDSDIAFENICDVLDDMQDSSSEVKEAKKYLGNLFNSLPELTDVFNESIQDEHIEQLNSLVEQAENSSKELFFQFLDCEKDNTPKEQEVLDQIANRPEVAEYFIRWRKEYESQKNESLSTQKKPKSHPQLPGIPGIIRSNIQLVNRLYDDIRDKYLYEPNRNFAYFFNAGEWIETEGEYLKWRGDWIAVSYLLRVLYCGKVNEKDGKEYIEAEMKMPDGAWNDARLIFRDCFGTKPGEKTLKYQTFANLRQKCSLDLDPILIPFLKEIGR